MNKPHIQRRLALIEQILALDVTHVHMNNHVLCTRCEVLIPVGSIFDHEREKHIEATKQ
jgi:hypothetical protein